MKIVPFQKVGYGLSNNKWVANEFAVEPRMTQKFNQSFDCGWGWPLHDGLDFS